MKKNENKDTRYFIDLDPKDMRILGWDYDQRQKLIEEELPSEQVRIYITKGQYKKLTSK